MQFIKYFFILLVAFSNLNDTTRKMVIDDIFQLKLIREIKLFPDGKSALLLINETSHELDKRVTHLWRTDFNNLEPVKLTNTKNGESYPQFYGDNKIAYLALHNGKQNIFVYDQSNAKENLLVEHNCSISAFCFSKDNKSVLYIASRNDNPAIENGLISSFFKVDFETPNSFLWKYDIEKRKKEILTPGDKHVKTMNLSPDGRKIILTMSPSAITNDEIKSEIYLFDFIDNRLKQLTSNYAQEKSVMWSPDGKQLTFLCDANRDLKYYYQYNLFQLNIDDEKPKIILEDVKYEIHSACYNKKGDGIYYLANMGTKQNLFYYNLKTGKNKQLTSEDAVISKIYYDTRFDFMLCAISESDKPDDLYQLDLDGKVKRQLSLLNPQLSRISLSKSKTIQWKSSDGWTCEGILHLPADYDSEKKYPLLVQLHGGPAGSYKLDFPTDYNAYTHILTGKGYMVFQPNYRGSTGYGDECMRSIIEHYFEKDVDDVITGVKNLVKSGYADSNKIGVFGWSAGGHLTNWLITHYDIFKAASSGAGMCNWISFYGTTEAKYIREVWFNGTPYEKYNDYLKKSPVLYSKNAKTPTIIFCGELDKRVPLSQSEEMFTALKKAGCVTEFIVFPGNGHGIYQISKQKIKIEKEIEWFDKYLK